MPQEGSEVVEPPKTQATFPKISISPAYDLFPQLFPYINTSS